MHLHILFHKNRIRIGIAVSAQMAAGIVSSYVSSQQTRACIIPLILTSLRNSKSLMKRFLVHLYCHAPGAIRPTGRKGVALGTGADRHAIGAADLHQRLAQGQLLLRRHGPDPGEVALRLFQDYRTARGENHQHHDECQYDTQCGVSLPDTDIYDL